MKNLIALLLAPLSLIYWSITAFRNHLYNINYSRSFTFEKPVIAVGNLEVGGTGKTPMVEYLIRLLKDKYHLATLSRGYGRKTKGFILANEQQSPATIGDEPYQYFLKFSDKISVAVGEERAWAIPQILLEKPETEVFLLDDAFQHRKVKADFNILLTRYSRPFYHDFPLPSGRLRESRNEANRAQAIVVTKCPPDLVKATMEAMKTAIERYAAKVPVFFSTINYLQPKRVFNNDSSFSENIILFTGLANPQDVLSYAQRHFQLLEVATFPDHHRYQKSNLQKLTALYKKHEKLKPVLLTTEKDMVKIQQLADENFRSMPVFYLPIAIQLLENGKNFDSLVENSILNKIQGEQ